MGDTKIEQAGTKNIGEIKVGVESQIKTSLNLWGISQLKSVTKAIMIAFSWSV